MNKDLFLRFFMLVFEKYMEATLEDLTAVNQESSSSNAKLDQALMQLEKLKKISEDLDIDDEEEEL